MSHTVNKAPLVKGFLMKEFEQIIPDLIFIIRVFDMLLHIVEHTDNLDIGAAMLWSFQGSQRCRNGGISIRT